MPYYRTTVDPELLPEFVEAGRRVLGTDNYDTLLGVLNGSDRAFKDQLLKAFDELRHEKKNRSGPRTITELIEAAHLLVFDLLRTEVTAFDVTTALEKRCETWDEPTGTRRCASLSSSRRSKGWPCSWRRKRARSGPRLKRNTTCLSPTNWAIFLIYRSITNGLTRCERSPT